MKKTLYVDMDNVLVDFQSGIDKIDPMILEDYSGRPDEIPDIFSLMLPMKDAIESVEKLSNHFDIYALSTASWNNPSAWGDKLNWIKKYFPVILYKRLILTHHKNLNIGDYLIDDRTKNGAGDFQGELLMFGPEGFSSWKEITEYLIGMEQTHKMNRGGSVPPAKQKPMTNNIKELIAQVKEGTIKELEYCNEVDTPYVCSYISDAKGKEMIVNLIVEYVGKNGMTISEAINYIERDNNPRLSND